MENFDYEKSIKRLEEIASSLENGKLSLDEMIKLYSEGTKLAASLSEALNNAQIKITKLTAGNGENDE